MDSPHKRYTQKCFAPAAVRETERSIVRILIADDHSEVRKALKALIQTRSWWHVVGEAINGLEAVEMALQLSPDVVLLDMSMPKLDGLCAARQIRATASQCELIILTCHNSGQCIRAALDAGVRGFVVKANAGRELFAAVEAVCQQEIFISEDASFVSAATK